MKSIVKEVFRSVWYSENSGDHWSSDAHPLRKTITYAKMEDGTCVDLPESQILSYFEKQRFTDKLLGILDKTLKGKSLSYKSTSSGNVLDGDFIDYL